ncbi:MAG: phosphoribosylglycinamide formyltransferase [Methylococcales bacterium]
MKISFIASHGGSSAKQIIAAMQEKSIAAELGVIITNNSDSEILRWCKEQQLNVHLINAKTHPEPAAEDLAMLTALTDAQSDLIVLSGYMKRIGPQTLSRFSGKILNIHPSLLPKHGGQGMYGDRVHAAVLKAGETVSGATIHVVTDQYDEGPILNQRQVTVDSNDTLESLSARVQAIEAGLYIETLKTLVNKPQ